MRSEEKRNWKVWILPLAALLLTLAWGAFTRLMVGMSDHQNFNFGTTPFVPAESPHATGPDSR